MDARSPRQDELTLTQRNVYIVPSLGGWVFAAVTLVLLLAAINEQLNLAYALAFLLGGVGLSAMSTTHANLRGLRLSLGTSTRVHAGQPAAVTVKLEAQSGRQGRYGLLLDRTVLCEVPPGASGEATLSVLTKTRGWLVLPRWRLETTYPLGLFRAWSYWRAASPVLVWPALEASPPEPPVASALPSEQERPTPMQHRKEAHDLRPWRRGDALKDVAWRKSATRLASGQEPVSREAAQSPRPTTHWIEWEATAGLPTEARLSRLAAWLVAAEREAQRTGVPYGLRMPSLQRDGQQGLSHLHRCLDDLALWGQTA
jgi:uncharacterized protein (DUF58 family)